MSSIALQLIDSQDAGMGGNGCGHAPSDPTFFQPNPSHKNRPDVLIWARLNLERFYKKPASWLKSLQSSRDTSRQQRSEARERDAGVLSVLLHYLELSSMRVGYPKADGKFVSPDMKFIAKALGWRTDDDDAEDKARINEGKLPRNRGVKRVWRSIRNLKRAGYITVHKRFEKRWDGEKDYTGLPAVRCIQKKLFWELGISGTKLRAKRDEATKRLKKKHRKYIEGLESKLGLGRVVQEIRQFTQNISGRRGYKRNSQQREAAYPTEAFERKRQASCYTLRQLPENKHLSAEEFYIKYPHLRHPSLKQSE